MNAAADDHQDAMIAMIAMIVVIAVIANANANEGIETVAEIVVEIALSAEAALLVVEIITTAHHAYILMSNTPIAIISNPQ